MAKKRENGDRVKLVYPKDKQSDPFHGQTGYVVGHESMGKGADNNYYRVKLDKPVKVGGQEVEDDLWTAPYVKSHTDSGRGHKNLADKESKRG